MVSIPHCVLLLFPLSSLTLLLAQTTATLSGRVFDPSGNLVPAAEVRLLQRLNHFERVTLTDAAGQFRFANLPFQTYELVITRDGFHPLRQLVTLRDNVPHWVDARLELATTQSTLVVSAGDAAPLVDPAQTGSYAQMNQGDIQRLPLQVGNRGLEAVLLTFPGFAQNANGAIHPRGAHNQITFVIDGMPITDQLAGAFANAVDPNIVETVELFTGNIPAEFGNKVAAVVNVTTKSGLGVGRPAAGSAMVSGAQFDTLAQVAQVAGESGRWGYSASANLMKSNRYLDQVSLDNLHNGGNSQRGFLRLDWLASSRHTLRFNTLTGRSSFQLANLRSQHAAGMAQRQLLADQSALAGWVYTASSRTTVDATASFRSSSALLSDSPADTPVTAWQDRRLATAHAVSNINHVRGNHQLRVGASLQRFPVREYFRFAITNPAFNHPESDDYIETLAAFDLSRGGEPFRFAERGVGQLASGYAQDSWRVGRWQVALGIRYDAYRFLLRQALLQPRLGVAFHLPENRTVLRASYNRTFQPPPNENLLLSNSPAAAVLVTPAVRATAGADIALVKPERQHFYELGLQQSLSRRAALNLAYFHKDGRNQQDNNNFFNTPVVFPTSLARIRVNAVEARLVVPRQRGFSATVSATHYRAIATPPFTGGLFLGNSGVEALSQGPFVIDHDQKLALHSVMTYEHSRGIFTTVSIRHDSGLVTNPSDPTHVAADPDFADLLPYVNLTATPPRTRPRTVTDLVLGYSHSSDGGSRRWEVALQLSNVTNVTALYNFQSLFVGTRLLQPRTAGLRLRWFF